MYEQIVIAGAGQAAVQAVDTLRRKGFTGKLTLIGEEPWLPYQRPPLSKRYLAGALERERLRIRPAQFFTEHGVTAHLGRRVTDIARRERHVRLDDGLVLPYDALLLATGSRPRRLLVPGGELPGVHTLRTIADVDRIRAECAAGARMVIIGGGYIGLEVAATARELGLEVTVLEMAERVMNRVTCAEVSAFYAAEHACRACASTAMRACGRYTPMRAAGACARCSPRKAENTRPTSCWSASASCRRMSWRRARGLSARTAW
jgi:3-phenylpropionate/trans-cinnamate dioxygenase ferredoxin reductase subunit